MDGRDSRARALRRRAQCVLAAEPTGAPAEATESPETAAAHRVVLLGPLSAALPCLPIVLELAIVLEARGAALAHVRFRKVAIGERNKPS